MSGCECVSETFVRCLRSRAHTIPYFQYDFFGFFLFFFLVVFKPKVNKRMGHSYWSRRRKATNVCLFVSVDDSGKGPKAMFYDLEYSIVAAAAAADVVAVFADIVAAVAAAVVVFVLSDRSPYSVVATLCVAIIYVASNRSTNTRIRK